MCVHAVRSASAFTKAQCILFTIPRDAYVKMRADEAKSGDLYDDVRFLSTLPWLRGVSSEVLVRLALRSHKREHPKGTVIAKEASSKCDHHAWMV